MVYAAGAARPVRLHLAIFLGRVTSVLALVVGALYSLVFMMTAGPTAWTVRVISDGER